MMEILFLIFHGLSGHSGISNKIRQQVKGLAADGHSVSLCTYHITTDGRRIRSIDGETIADYGKGKWAACRKRFSYDSIYKYAVTHRKELVYVRSFHNANPFTIRLFRKLRKAGIRIVMEIPTFPYDMEYKGFPFLTRMELLTDKLFRKALAGKTNAIVTYSGSECIFGQRTIRISNGVDFSSVPLKSYTGGNSRSIHLIGVAEVHYWHGYDRLIHGLGEYCRTPRSTDVYFHIVGGTGPSEMYDSQHAPGFHELITKYGIQDYVVFHGQQAGKELDALFDLAVFGIGSLARHRCRIDRIKTLKNREYAARGLPFIYSETDEDFDGMPYIMKASADESAIDIASIVRFCQNRLPSPEEIRNSIRHLSWKRQMAIVIKNL